MKHATWTVALAALLLLLPVSCSSDIGQQSSGKTQAPLNVPSLTPVPCNGGEFTWDGTRVELLFADAVAGCATGDSETVAAYHGFPLADRALRDVVAHMEGILSTQAPDDPFAKWRTQRADDDFNCDPDDVDTPAFIEIPKHPIKELVVFTSPEEERPWTMDMANMDLRWAGLNLCVAMRLREFAPGVAGSEALLMSNAEQRELLETIRERSQIAMLQYALLGSVFASPGEGAEPLYFEQCPCNLQPPLCDDVCIFWDEQNPARHYRIPFLQYFGRHVSPSVLRDMGKDFASAVQLHTLVTQEMFELLARSRSARLERGGDAELRADETWGPGSWQQRLLAAAYNGDPLAEDAKSPWKHPSGLSGPAQNPPPWPPRTSLSYVRQSVDQPEVQTAYTLLRKHDVLDLALTGSGNCRTIDPETSTDAVYQALETKVREKLCVDFDPITEQCTPVMFPSDPEQHALFLYYRVRKEHVSAAINLVSDLIGPQIDVGSSVTCPSPRYGSHDPVGTVTLSGNSLHVAGSTQFTPHVANSIASAFGTLSSTRFTTVWQVEPLAPSNMQGFSTDNITTDLPGGGTVVIPGGAAAEDQRIMGGIRALVVTRELVANALERLRNLTGGAAEVARLNDYFAQADAIIRVTSGAVRDSFSVYPTTQLTGSAPEYGVEPQDVPGGKGWLGSVTVDENDSFWIPDAGSSLYLVMVPDDGWSGTLAAYPNSHVLGRGAAEQLVNAFSANRQALLIPTVGSGGQDIDGLRRLVSERAIPLHPDSAYFTFFAWKGTTQEFADTAASICSSPPCSSPSQLFGRTRLLAANVSLFPASATKASYFSQTGALGSWVAAQIQPDSANPSEPAYDAFGFPNAWVPPANAQVLGGTPGTPGFRHFLDAAEKSSTEAADAVDSAIGGLLEQVADEKASQALDLKLQNETIRSDALLKESAQRLCGFNHTSCDTVTEKKSVQASWYTNIGGGLAPITPTECQIAANASSGTTEQQVMDAVDKLLRCIAADAVSSLLTTEFDLAGAVEKTLSQSTVPTFSDYAGGELQSALVEQWRAVKAPEERLKLMYAQIAASKAAVKTASKVVAKDDKILSHKCGLDDILRDTLNGMISGASAGAPLGPFGAAAGAIIGGADAQQQFLEKCDELASQLDVSVAAQYQASKEAIANVISTITGLLSDRAEIVQSGIHIGQLSSSADLEQARYSLELDLTGTQIASEQAQLKTSFGLYRRYRSYDAWRAKALLDNARRYALAARRGIEAHYVVDLSRVTQDEAFVSNPASWADEVYEYDLSLPAAVGLSIGQTAPGGIFSNKVGDYVSNLNGFVDGFAVTRPSAVADEDVDVVTLKGVAPGESLPFDDSGTIIDTYPDFGTWQVKCALPSGDEWKSVPPVTAGGVELACIDYTACPCEPTDLACIGTNACPMPRPVAARTVFWLDPWARLNQGVLLNPYAARYNARWTRLAVNLVGTGIRDCASAPDPLTCYSEGFLRFDLQHIGGGWLTDFAGQWHALGFPSGRIEGGKALAAELWLDPLKDGWSTSYISAVQRAEFFWRPLYGAYVLEIETGPEVRLEQLERVQVLVGSSYWVAQQ